MMANGFPGQPCPDLAISYTPGPSAVLLLTAYYDLPPPGVWDRLGDASCTVLLSTAACTVVAGNKRWVPKMSLMSTVVIAFVDPFTRLKPVITTRPDEAVNRLLHHCAL